MRHTATKEIFAYWDTLRGFRRAPERLDLSPAGFGRHLPDLFLLEHEPGDEFRFRIAGSRLCTLFGRELRGKAFLDVFSQPALEDARDMLAATTEDVLPVVAGLSALLPDRDAIEAEMLLLPLVHKESTGGRLLGSFSPRSLDGRSASPCAALEILSFRVLSDVELQYFHAAHPVDAGNNRLERRAQLRLLQGGRA